MPSDASTPPLDAAGLEDAYASLEQRVARARADAEHEPLEEAQRLVGVESDLLALELDLARSDPEMADDRGHPALADAARWRGRAQTLGLESAGARAHDLVEGLVGDEMRRWRDAARQAVEDRDATACFQLLGEATVLDRETLNRRPLDDENALERTDRGPLRDGFATILEGEPPDDALRETWVVDLLDRADVVLTGIDDLDAVRASANLEMVADDLRWHLDHVERPRGARRRRLKRKLRRLRVEMQERNLTARLEGMFGPRRVARFEQLVLTLLFLVLGILAVDLVFDLSEQTRYWLTIVDTLACLVFLWEFFFRLALVKGRWGWFLRHAFVDFLPSIPFGLLVLGQGAASGPDPIRAGRAIRLLRLTRLARSVRAVMPLIRLVRAVGFLTRGLDRLVRRYGHLLNRDVILYPTREEKLRAEAAESGLVPRVRALRAEVTDLWDDLVRSAGNDGQEGVVTARIAGLERAREDGITRRPPTQRVRAATAREVPADALLRRMGAVTAEGVEADLGPDFVTRAARAVRIFARPPLRWIPPFSKYVPRLGAGMTDAEVTAAAAHHAASRMRDTHDRLLWFGDLYGTITPAEFVDRVGSTLVKRAFRPASRLAMFGGFYLLVILLLELLQLAFLQKAEEFLFRFVGTPLVVLGVICGVVLAVGFWMKRLASQATTFYEQTAAAQFLSLTESIKGRTLARDAALVVRRVLAPEDLVQERASEVGVRRRRFVDGVRAWLMEAHAGGDASGAFDAMERAVLLYRDGLDGALLCDSDTRTTNQLLGNPALRHLLRTAGCVTPAEQKRVQQLGLDRRHSLFGGPYLWFSMITRSVSQAAARLIVDYNRNAIPLAEVDLASAKERSRMEAWLAGRSEESDRAPEPAVLAKDAGYVTAAFTALHFLDDDPRRDHEVEQRFGLPVLHRLREDRRVLFRRIFGTYPLHLRPKGRRVVNLYKLYEEWLAGGRAILLPLRALLRAFKWLGTLVRGVVQAIREIRRPPLKEEIQAGAEADFATAVRKIERMRGPVVRACLWLRARVDGEYLGVRLPGMQRTGLEGAGVEEDLEFLDAEPALRRQVEEERDLAHADMRRLSRLIRDGLPERVAAAMGIPRDALNNEHLRAAAFAYRADVDGVRSHMSASDILHDAFRDAARRPLLPRRWWLPFGSFRRGFVAWWRENGRGTRAARRAAWRAALHDVHGAGRALKALGRLGQDEAVAEGERRLARVLRHPGRLSEQLVTLRVVQTLALLDVLNYRVHVWNLGRYEDDGETPGMLLTLGTSADAVEEAVV